MTPEAVTKQAPLTSWAQLCQARQAGRGSGRCCLTTGTHRLTADSFALQGCQLCDQSCASLTAYPQQAVCVLCLGADVDTGAAPSSALPVLCGVFSSF